MVMFTKNKMDDSDYMYFFCSCKCGLKQYYCVHTTGLMMMWGVRKIQMLIGKRRNKGRIKKAKYALSKD